MLECWESFLIMEETAVRDLFFKHRFGCWFTWRDTIDLGVSLWGETLKLSYVVECGKKSVMAYTWMAPLHQTPWVCHSQASDPTPPHPVSKEACRDLALMRQQAFLWLVTNCCVKPFSWLEAAPSTSYYFTEWKGFTINDAIMLMELPSCLFASPSTKYQSWWRMRKCKHHCTNSECISAHESELSLEMEALETINNWLGNNSTLVHCHLLSHANLSIGRRAEVILLRSNQILDLKGF